MFLTVSKRWGHVTTHRPRGWVRRHRERERNVAENPVIRVGTDVLKDVDVGINNTGNRKQM